jgi:ABC-type transport system involved in cytochrome bd biosynthesis fused ATPase/permease subunit
MKDLGKHVSFLTTAIYISILIIIAIIPIFIVKAFSIFIVLFFFVVLFLCSLAVMEITTIKREIWNDNNGRQIRATFSDSLYFSASVGCCGSNDDGSVNLSVC